MLKQVFMRIVWIAIFAAGVALGVLGVIDQNEQDARVLGWRRSVNDRLREDSSNYADLELRVQRLEATSGVAPVGTSCHAECFAARKKNVLSSEEIIQLYADNEQEIAPIWAAMEDGTMKDAVMQWQSNRTKGRKELYAEAKSLFEKYQRFGLDKRESKRRAKEEMSRRYAGDGRILNILYWIFKFGLLFIFIL